MSFSNRKDGGGGGGGKSVRFAANVNAPDDADDDDAKPHFQQDAGPRRKRPRLERPNPDEEDDVDDWNEQEEQEDDLPVVNAKTLLDAKRKRRHHDDLLDDDEDTTTHVDAQTSLLAEDIAVEPFNMNAEQSDGTGYFDGDTYVFRKHAQDEEPDAWLESLSEEKQGQQQVASIPERTTMNDETETEANSINDLSKEDLVSKIVPLVSENESVLQAVARFGNLLKRNKSKSTANKDDSSVQTAQTALNDLTEAANALMLQGHVDIYQQTKTELLKVLADSKPAAKDKQHVSWEYRGNQDGQVHGPYTTQQMVAWIQAGYFIGEQAVQIRTIAKALPEQKSTADELMSDLMEDDDEQQPEETQVKGEWTSSNDIDFSVYQWHDTSSANMIMTRNNIVTDEYSNLVLSPTPTVL